MEITVFKPIEEEKVLSKEEREILFYEISEQLNIPLYYLEEIGKLEDEAISNEVNNIKPELMSLLVRRLMDFDNVIPIVKELKNPMRTIEGFYESFGLKLKKEGGAPKSIKKLLQNKQRYTRSIPTINTQSSQIINTQLIKSQKLIYMNNLVKFLNDKKPERYIDQAPSNEFLDICGIVILNEPIVKYYIDSLIGGLSLSAKLRIGNYYDTYLWNTMFSPYKIMKNKNYEKNLMNNLHILSKSRNGPLYFIFNNQTHESLGLIFDYLIYCLKYLYNDYQAKIINLAHNEFMKENCSEFYKHLVMCFDIFNTPTIVERVYEDYSQFKIPELKKFLEDIEKNELYFGKFNYKWSNSIWFDMYSYKIILEKLLLINQSETTHEQKKQYSKDIEDFIQKRKQIKLHDKLELKHRMKSLKQLLLEMTYRYLYIKKFGYGRFEEIEKKMPIFNIERIGYIFDLISSKEKDLILSDYQHFQIKKEKKPWSKIVSLIQRSNNLREREKLFEELQSFLPKNANEITNDWIKSEFGEIIICPHLYSLISLEKKYALQKDGESKIRDEIIKFSGNTPLFGAFYCKICGELISYSEELESNNIFEQRTKVWHSLDEFLQPYIWKHVNQVVRNYVEFKELHTTKYINMFISDITNKLYDFINLIEKKLIKSKTNSIEEIENKKKLFTYIYIYAILIKIILDNKESISFTKLQNPTIDKLMKYSLDKITYTQNIVISKLPDVNESFLESSLSKAYKNIVLVIDKTKLEAPPELNLIISIMLDPVYSYIVNMTILSKLKGGNLLQLVEFYQNPIHLYTTLVAKNLDDLVAKILQTDFTYKSIDIPKFPDEITELFINITESVTKNKLTNGTSQNNNKSNSNTFESNWESYVEGYFILSFQKFSEYIKSQIYLLPIFIVKITKDPNNENITIIDINLTEPYIQFEKSMETIKKGEKFILELTKYHNPYAYFNVKIKSPIMFYYKTNNIVNLLSREYGYQVNNNKLLKLPDSTKLVNKFHKHKWRIYAYIPLEKYKGDNVSFYNADDLVILDDSNIAEKFKDQTFLNYKLIDRLCKICFYPLSEIEKVITDPVKIIQDEQILINFYNYYENRCPEVKNQSVHEFNSENVCKKCGFNKLMYFNHDEKYFHKYYHVFKDFQKKNIKDDKKNKSIPINFNIQSAVQEILIKPDKEIINWKYNSNIVNELILKTFDFMQKGSQIREANIEIFKYKKTEYYNIISNLGLIEKYDFEKILNGTDNPSRTFLESTILQFARIDKIDIYIKEIIFNYTILLNHKNLPHPPLDIKLIIKECNNQELSGIQKLPTINSIHLMGYKYSYFQVIKIVRETFYDNPIKIAEFLLEYFCQLLLHLLMIIEKHVSKKISQEMIIFLISNIIHMEKITSKIKESKSAEIEAIHKPDLIDDGVMQDHDQSRSYDGLIKGNKVSDYEYDFDFSDPGLDAGNYNSQM